MKINSREYCPRCGAETCRVDWFEGDVHKAGWSCDQCDIRMDEPPFDPYTDYFDDGGWDKGDYDSPFFEAYSEPY